VDQLTHNKIVSLIWGITDDVLGDLSRRGMYPDVILPMCLLRRMAAVLEPTKQALLATKRMLDGARIGYEINFTRHFRKAQPLRALAEIGVDILAAGKEAERLLDGLLVAAAEP
jgi:type I restriction-modification system DNA methylase subunit